MSIRKSLAVMAVLLKLARFRQIVVEDTEFESAPGERQKPVCGVFKELRTGRVHRIFRGDFGKHPPFSTGPDAVHIAYYTSAEWGSYRALGWPMPERVLDLFTEFRNRTNGLPTTAGGASLLGALAYFRIAGIDPIEKASMQEAIGSGTWRGRYSKTDILDYCQADVLALERLLPVMLPEIDLPRALLRGRYMVAASAMEWNGVPVDVPTLDRLRKGWGDIQDQLIADIDRDFGVYEGRSFRSDRFAEWLIKEGIPWPRLEDGHLDLEDDTFRQMAKSYPAVSPLRELRSSLSELRLNDLAVGSDGRNRCVLSAFRARTGRNQPSNSKFIFGPSVWIRGLIKPPPGYGIAYIDWKQQEFGIAAALSGDPVMGAAYSSGDPYLAFAKQAGAAPECATKQTHGPTRELFKQCVLAVQYGMGEDSLAQNIGQTFFHARELLRLHHEIYRVFWRWSDASVAYAMLTGSIHTTFGWRVRVPPDPNIRSLRNFLMQANGAEMLRISCCLATEHGIEVCAPVHDAVLICAPLDRLEADIAGTQAAMCEASKIVLGGFELGTDVKVVRYPDRYSDDRGVVMWERVMRLIAEREAPDGI